MSVGMPRPLSITVQEPSGLSVTRICGRVPGQRLIDRVVDDLVDHVMQARAVIGIADIHARPFAHRIEALQDLDALRAIVVFARHTAHVFQTRMNLLRAYGAIADAQELRPSIEGRKGGCLGARHPGLDASASISSNSAAAPSFIEGVLRSRRAAARRFRRARGRHGCTGQH